MYMGLIIELYFLSVQGESVIGKIDGLKGVWVILEIWLFLCFVVLGFEVFNLFKV